MTDFWRQHYEDLRATGKSEGEEFENEDFEAEAAAALAEAIAGTEETPGVVDVVDVESIPDSEWEDTP